MHNETLVAVLRDVVTSRDCVTERWIDDSGRYEGVDAVILSRGFAKFDIGAAKFDGSLCFTWEEWCGPVDDRVLISRGGSEDPAELADALRAWCESLDDCRVTGEHSGVCH